MQTLSQHSYLLSRLRVDGAYKRKSQKVQPVDLSLSDGSKPDGSDTWKVNAIKKKVLILDPTDKYSHGLISKFTPIMKGAGLTLERLAKMIVGNSMTAKEKDVLIKMLYNQKAVLAWDFSEIGKVKREVALLQKIRIVKQKAWQIPGF